MVPTLKLSKALILINGTYQETTPLHLFCTYPILCITSTCTGVTRGQRPLVVMRLPKGSPEVRACKNRLIVFTMTSPGAEFVPMSTNRRTVKSSTTFVLPPSHHNNLGPEIWPFVCRAQGKSVMIMSQKKMWHTIQATHGSVVYLYLWERPCTITVIIHAPINCQNKGHFWFTHYT